MLGAVCIERISRHKEHADLLTEQLIDCEPHHRDNQCNHSRQFVSLLHPVIKLCSEVVAVDRLCRRGDTDKHGMGNLLDLHHHTVSRKSCIAAINALRTVNRHQIIHRNLHHCSHNLRQQAWKSQRQNLPSKLPSGL